MKVFQFCFSSILVLSAALAQASQPAQCKQGSFISGPEWDGNTFMATMRSTCELSVNNANFAGLNQYYRTKTKSEVTEVYRTLPVEHQGAVVLQAWDEQLSTDEGSIRALVKIGTDREKTFVFSSHSSDIDFHGFAAYVEKLELDIRVEKIADAVRDDRYLLTLTSRAEVAKPGLIPRGAFFNLAQKQAISHFESSLNDLAAEVLTHLK